MKKKSRHFYIFKIFCEIIFDSKSFDIHVTKFCHGSEMSG